MIKLYPPVIKGTIPANCGGTLKIPYEMNKAVGYSEIKGFNLKLKTIQGNKSFEPITSYAFNQTTGIAFFNLGALELEEGSFYKVQLAYISSTGTPGYYSTVGVMKYVAEPSVTIESAVNGVFIGKYSQRVHADSKYDDSTERVYSYNFKLIDSKGNLIEESGEQLHNSDNDTDLFESYDEFTITKELNKNEAYSLVYTVKTINGLEKSSASKRIFKADSIDSKLNTKLSVKLDYDNGYVDVALVNPNPGEVEDSAVGSFMLLRSSDEDNYASWNEVLKFALYGQKPSRHLWKDMTVKQGINYKYAIQQYNSNGLRSNKTESETIYVDFEDAFLFDGARQLKIRYNPKVSSFKNTLLENKVDTIGGKYPFIFRNGNVKYKEFPISGLISYLVDEEKLFYPIDFDAIDEERKYKIQYQKVELTEEEFRDQATNLYVFIEGDFKTLLSDIKTSLDEFYLYYTMFYNIYKNNLYKKTAIPNNNLDLNSVSIRTTDLISSNIAQERNFKLEVLEWLTNGEPKLFRSPTEGNYLVRLLNVSLSPEDTVGRMLHTFNCTAYEIAEYSYDTLEEYGIITTDVPDNKQLRWETIVLDPTTKGNVLKHYPISAVRMEGMNPGDKFNIIWASGDSTSIVVGVTGSYIIDLDSGVEINSIVFDTPVPGSTLTYAYYSTEFKDSFDTIEEIAVLQTPVRQFVGYTGDILEAINDVKNQLESVGRIKFYLRDSEAELYRQEDAESNYYYTSDKEGANKVDPRGSIDLYTLYDNTGELIGTYDGYNDELIHDKKALEDEQALHKATQIILNGKKKQTIDLWDTYSYEIRQTEGLTSVEPGAAIIAEITYQSKSINYDVERTNETVKAAKKAYEDEKALTGFDTLDKIITHEDKLKELYNIYIEALEQAIKEEERS